MGSPTSVWCVGGELIYTQLKNKHKCQVDPALPVNSVVTVTWSNVTCTIPLSYLMNNLTSIFFSSFFYETDNSDIGPCDIVLDLSCDTQIVR